MRDSVSLNAYVRRFEKFLKQVTERPANCLIRQFIENNVSETGDGVPWLKIRFCEAEKLMRDNPLPVTEEEYFYRECYRAFPVDPYDETSSPEARSFWAEVFRFCPDPYRVHVMFWGE